MLGTALHPGGRLTAGYLGGCLCSLEVADVSEKVHDGGGCAQILCFTGRRVLPKALAAAVTTRTVQDKGKR
jgi:hypothetical protein